MAKNRNTFEKRRREVEKRQRMEDKRQKRVLRKAQAESQLDASRADASESDHEALEPERAAG